MRLVIDTTRVKLSAAEKLTLRNIASRLNPHAPPRKVPESYRDALDEALGIDDADR